MASSAAGARQESWPCLLAMTAKGLPRVLAHIGLSGGASAREDQPRVIGFGDAGKAWEDL
ncbi:MAG: hypothetical protein ACHQAQ_06810 [Hyphomicrobiales bacterium]